MLACRLQNPFCPCIHELKDKWGRILDRWRKHPTERLRLAVFIDGINQRPEKDWARVAEKFGAELDQIGGQLIVTVRTQYYRDQVQPRLSRDHKEVEIPKWTEQERDRILAGRGIIATNLQPKVAASLLNPRLLGIALELLEGDDLAGLEEVSVNHLMVAGFSDNSEFNDNVLDHYQDKDYFIGDAHNAARYAYDRNTWARHWFAQMCEADEADEFWRFSILFAKIVDGRYEFWRSEYKDRNEPMRLFWPSVRSRLRNRFKKWENLRDKKLFGGDAPSRIFLF